MLAPFSLSLSAFCFAYSKALKKELRQNSTQPLLV